MKHIGTKRIETKGLILRPFKIRDASSMFHNWASDREVTKYLTWQTHKDVFVTESIVKEWIGNYANKDFYMWAITLKENEQEPIGAISVVNEIDERVQIAQIGYCIGRNWWRKGIATEALQAVIRYMFEEVGVRKVEARCNTANENSGAVMKKCHMKYEGTLRQTGWDNQGICDMDHYGMLEQEYKSQVTGMEES